MIKNKLKEIRMKEYGMERIEFSEFLGINRKTYYGLESDTNKPSIIVALEIAKKLNKHVDEIWYID